MTSFNHVNRLGTGRCCYVPALWMWKLRHAGHPASRSLLQSSGSLHLSILLPYTGSVYIDWEGSCSRLQDPLRNIREQCLAARGTGVTKVWEWTEGNGQAVFGFICLNPQSLLQMAGPHVSSSLPGQDLLGVQGPL